MTTATASDLCFTPASELLECYRRGELSPVEATRAVLERIERHNPTLRAYLHVDADGALRAAAAAEAAYLAGNAGPLAGVPLSIKDLVNVRDMPTTFGSLLYRDYVATEDAISVERLRRAGAILLGKANTPEFGSLPTNENKLGEPARNPWNPDHTPGGSSGGTGAAIAAGLGPLGLGTDVGGSIRIPAACCGVFGLKPTLGRIARDTSFVLTGDFFSHEGPLSRTVLDAALYLDATAGPDPRDRFSQLGPHTPTAPSLDALPRHLRVAWHDGGGRVDRAYLAVCEQAVRSFEGAARAIEPDQPEGMRDALSVWALAAWSGNYNAERAEKQKANLDLLTEAVRRDLQMVEGTTMTQYFNMVATVRAWRSRAAAFFERYDLLIEPAMVTTAPRIGQQNLVVNGEEQRGTFGMALFTMPWNLTGQPAAIVPCGFTAEGLPVALQIVGRFGDDLLVLQAARAFEQIQPWVERRPADET
jgi:aspartyl-tRNA(Asn)/glutamyl-tRNA(Gln) amidotransferase subunit A